MRAFLIVLSLLALFATGWHAAFQGTTNLHMKGAPQIEREIHRAAIAIVAGAGGDPVEVRTSGRHVVLTGAVESPGKRDMLVSRISALPLVSRLSDNMTVLQRADPYTLEIVKAPDGAMTISGFVPNRRIEDRLLAEARSVSGRAGLSARLDLAAGAPAGNWAGMVSTGLEALDGLNHGKLAIENDTVELSGEAVDDIAEANVQDIVASAPMGNWSTALTQGPPPDGFLFAATKPLEGPVTIWGHAPDESMQVQLLTSAGDLLDRRILGTLKIAIGMPGPGWPDEAINGLEALAYVEKGRIELREWAMRIEGTVDTDADYAALAPHLGEDWEVSVSIRNPTPHGNARLLVGGDGRATMKGLLPEGIGPEDVSVALPGVNVDGLDPIRRGKKSNWLGALDGLAIVIPRFEDMEARIVGETINVRGLLKPDFSQEGVHATLRSATGPGWEILVTVLQSRPYSEVTLSLDRGRVSMSGLLPFGLEPEVALALTGNNAAGVGLVGGGDGNVAQWRNVFEAIGELLGGFRTLEVEVIEERMILQGALRSGYEATDVRSFLDQRVADSWDVEMTIDETNAYEGARRTNLLSGEEETFRSGHWLPDLKFDVSAETCSQEIDTLMAAESIDFAEAETEVPPESDDLLNRLAAIAIRCVASADFRIEIGAHTASVGNDEANQKLSEDRAIAIARALIRRGVRNDGLVAIGYGETVPIASNDTSEGRQQNERIAFRILEGNK